MEQSVLHFSSWRFLRLRLRPNVHSPGDRRIAERMSTVLHIVWRPMRIRPVQLDACSIWRILHPITRAAYTYALTEAHALAYWLGNDREVSLLCARPDVWLL